MTDATTIRLGFSEKEGAYYGKFKDPKTGVWKTKWVPKTISEEEEAKSWFSNFLQGVGSGAVPKNAEVVKTVHTLTTMYPLWEKYLSDGKTSKSGNKLEPKTIASWKQRTVKYILSHPIASVPMTNERFTPVALLVWVETIKGSGLAKYSIKDVVQIMRTFIGDGRKKGWVDLLQNPMIDEIVRSEVPIGETVAGAGNIIHLSKDAAIALMQCCSASIPLQRKVKNVVFITEGVRSAEGQALAWKHIDLDKRTLTVERQLVKGGTVPKFKGCKKGSERTLPLHPLALRALKYLKKMSPRAKPDDAIFGDRNGLYCTGNAARNFRDDLRAADLSTQYMGKWNIDQHATRRTFLTLLTDSGVSEEAAGIMAGHAMSGVRKHYVMAHLERFIREIEKLPFGEVKLEWCK